MTTRQKRDRRLDGKVWTGLLIATEITALGGLQLWTEAPLLLWLATPAVGMTALLGTVITGLFYGYGEREQALWSALVFTASALAVAIIQIVAVTAVLR